MISPRFDFNMTVLYVKENNFVAAVSNLAVSVLEQTM